MKAFRTSAGRAGLVAAALGCTPCLAEVNNTLEITFDRFAKEFAVALGGKTQIKALDKCVPEPSDKRRACMFSAGESRIMIAAPLNSQAPTEITVICPFDGMSGLPKCLGMWDAAIRVSGEAPAKGDREQIFKSMMLTIGAGANEVRVVMEERRYIMQKALGIWFHVQAKGEI